MLISGVGVVVSEIVLFFIFCVFIFYICIWFLDVLFVSRIDEKYKTSNLKEQEILAIKQEILSKMKNEKLYRNEAFKVNDLAKSIGKPTHYISQTLNKEMHQNFYELVNSFRVEEVKDRLKKGDASKISIQAIGEECGFSNKTSFYRAFKKITNMTPNQYLKQNR